MNGPFVVAQATGAVPTDPPIQTITIYKPEAGKTVVFHASFDGKVKIDLTGIANEQITLYRDSATQTLQDRKSTRLNSSHIQKSRMPSSA